MATVKQILSTLSIDGATLSEYGGGKYAVIQRDPQPSEGNIRRETHIGMMFVDMDPREQWLLSGFGHGSFGYFPFGHPPLVIADGFDFDVLVDGQLILEWNNATGIATWHEGYSGSVTASGPLDPYFFYLVDAVPPNLFESEQTVSVEAVVWPGDSPALDETWQFQVEDITPPQIVSAEAIDAFTVRVTFDEGMSISGDGSLLNVENWVGTISRHNIDPVPGVNLEVLKIERLDGYGGVVFDLTVNWEMTQGCHYRLTVDENIEDDSGNPIDQEHRIADFVGFQFAPVPLRRFDHWTMMLPLKNRQEDSTRDLERFSNCIAEVLGLLLSDVDRFSDQFDPDLASDENIDAMLYDMGNPFTWPELVLMPDEKRKLLRVLVEIYKLKGTKVGIESTIRFILGHDVEVVPYALEGWVLGVDELGSGSIAEVWSENGETYDFTTAMDLIVEVDNYYDLAGQVAEQIIHFEPSNFNTPSIGTAAEVVAVINDQLEGGGAYPIGVGTPALFTISGSPFAISAGDTLEIEVNDIAHLITFSSADFADPAGATAEEVAAKLSNDVDSVIVTNTDTDVFIETKHTGDNASILVVGGTGLAALGLSAGDVANGSDALRVAIYSDTAGVGAWIKIIGGDVADVLGFENEIVSGTGGSILAPEDSYQLYSFDIETTEELDEDTKAIIRLITEYMKVGHEHLVNIRTEPSLPWPEGWILGISELDESTELMD